MISFPRLECWNATTEVATIAAIVDKKRILCRISLKTLHDKYGPAGDKPMQSVNQHREAIQDAAREIIERGDYEKDGSVLISLSNL